MFPNLVELAVISVPNILMSLPTLYLLTNFYGRGKVILQRIRGTWEASHDQAYDSNLVSHCAPTDCGNTLPI